MAGAAASQLFGQASSGTGNNYARQAGQNVGNFLGDRPSSRVLAAPGGNSTFSFGAECGWRQGQAVVMQRLRSSIPVRLSLLHPTQLLQATSPRRAWWRHSSTARLRRP